MRGAAHHRRFWWWPAAFHSLLPNYSIWPNGFWLLFGCKSSSMVCSRFALK